VDNNKPTVGTNQPTVGNNQPTVGTHAWLDFQVALPPQPTYSMPTPHMGLQPTAVQGSTRRNELAESSDRFTNSNRSSSSSSLPCTRAATFHPSSSSGSRSRSSEGLPIYSSSSSRGGNSGNSGAASIGWSSGDSYDDISRGSESTRSWKPDAAHQLQMLRSAHALLAKPPASVLLQSELDFKVCG
jgi:hypothetical protein